jgi:hypothetical protein
MISATGGQTVEEQLAQNVLNVQVLSKQLQEKAKRARRVAKREDSSDDDDANGPGVTALARFAQVEAMPRPAGRPSTDTLFSWNALPNEWIVPLGLKGGVPVLGGSVSRLLSRGVVRFPSSIQRIEFGTDNISSENQGVLVEGWACWRVSDPKLALQKLDFSDRDNPMLATSKTLAIECAGIMKGLISVKTVNDLLKRREDLIDRLHEKLKPTEQRWGISFDEIGVSEVQILSQEVFDNLQRPYRNEAREVASTSDLDTEERIASRTAAQKERVARLNAENANRLRELETKNETQIREVEATEQKKRILNEQEIRQLKIEEEKRVQLLQEQAQREVGEQRVIAEQRIAAARQAEQIRTEAEQREQRERLELARLELAREVAAAEKALSEAKKRAELALQLLSVESELDLERRRLAVVHEREEFRLKVAAEERRIMGQLSDAEIRAKVVEALPEIAANIRIGDVRWYGGSASDGPAVLLSRALDQVLDVAEQHGIELRRHAPNRDGSGPAPPKER